MSDFKDRMIEAVERGWATEATAYEFVADSYASAYDDWHTRAKEAGYRNPLIVPMFCQTCHYNKEAHPRDECATGFIPGDVEAAHDHNERIGFPSRERYNLSVFPPVGVDPEADLEEEANDRDTGPEIDNLAEPQPEERGEKP